MPARPLGYWLALLASAACSACSPPLAVIEGNVTYNGQKVDRGVVNFISHRDGSVHVAEIKPDGTYMIDGVPYGAATATVIRLPENLQSPGDQRMKQIAGGDKANLPLAHSTLPEKYATLTDNNPLKFEINASRNSFDLKLVD
jgi:hypothetical protein